jgi:hypothetical protein
MRIRFCVTVCFRLKFWPARPFLVPHTNKMIVYDAPDRKELTDQIPRTLG